MKETIELILTNKMLLFAVLSIILIIGLMLSRVFAEITMHLVFLIKEGQYWLLLIPIIIVAAGASIGIFVFRYIYCI